METLSTSILIMVTAAGMNSIILTAAVAVLIVRLAREAPKQGEGVEVCGVVDLKKREEEGEYNPSKDRKAGFRSR